MKVRQSISFEQQNLEQAVQLAKNEQTSLSFIVNRALFHYLNQSPTILRHEKSTPPLALDSRKTSGNNRTVRNRVKSD